MEFTRQDSRGVVFLTAPLLSRPGLRHGFSTRLGGVSGGPYAALNLRGAAACGDEQANVEENYRRLCAAVGVDAGRAVLSRQVHSDAVRLVTETDAGKGLRRPRDYDADALITAVPGLPLVVFSADCTVTLLWDPAAGCVGAVHAGWRGTAREILRKTVARMESAFGARPERMLAAIGPAIGPCCFETDGDVPAAMERAMGREAAPFLRRGEEKWLVDLKGLNRRQLELAGVPAEQVAVCGLCTACHPELFWSHRKMGDVRGVQGAVVALAAEGP